jgi:predicted nucleic acid-binding protein
MEVLVSDTSILIDLERADLCDTLFNTGHRIVVPDLLYQQELEPYDGVIWLERGLEIISLDEHEAALAQRHAHERRSISLNDAFAVAIAQTRRWTLLTGDRSLRECAATHGVACHGLLWLCELMVDSGCAKGPIATGLEKLLAHPQCRLPRHETLRLIAQLQLNST